MYASLLLLQASASQVVPTLVMYAAIAAIFYFIVWRPQARQRKQHEQTIRGLKRGDEVVTAGGIIGEVVHIREHTAGTPGPEDHVTIKSGESRLVVQRGRIVATAGTPAAAGAAAKPAAGSAA